MNDFFSIIIAAISFSILNFNAIEAADHKTATRAAIDFGSGSVKIQVNVVDLDDNSLSGQPLLTKYIPLNLTEDVATHGDCISPAMQQQAFSILSKLKQEALTASTQTGNTPLHFEGIATAVFRDARNGTALIKDFEEKLGIRFQILSQDDEGILGFITAHALFANTPQEKLLAWDSGNGSFQMTAKNNDAYQVYQGPVGYGVARVFLSKDIRKGPVLLPHQSGNPVLPAETLELKRRICQTLPPTPAWLKDILESNDVVIATFGDGESLVGIVANVLSAAKRITDPAHDALISLADVHWMADKYQGCTDQDFDRIGIHREAFMSALLLSAFMEHFGITKIHYQHSVGSTPGMLLLPKLWLLSLWQTPSKWVLAYSIGHNQNSINLMKNTA